MLEELLEAKWLRSCLFDADAPGFAGSRLLAAGLLEFNGASSLAQVHGGECGDAEFLSVLYLLKDRLLAGLKILLILIFLTLAHVSYIIRPSISIGETS